MVGKNFVVLNGILKLKNYLQAFNKKKKKKKKKKNIYIYIFFSSNYIKLPIQVGPKAILIELELI